MQALPYAFGLPFAQTPQTGHAAAAAHFLWQVFPTDASLQHKDDASQRTAVIDAFAAWKTKAARLRGRQERFNDRPEFIIHQWFRHGLSSQPEFTLILPHGAPCPFILLGALNQKSPDGFGQSPK